MTLVSSSLTRSKNSMNNYERKYHQTLQQSSISWIQCQHVIWIWLEGQVSAYVWNKHPDHLVFLSTFVCSCLAVMGHSSWWVVGSGCQMLTLLFLFVACIATTSNNALHVLRSMTLGQSLPDTHNANLWLSANYCMCNDFPHVVSHSLTTHTAHQRICWASSRDRLKSLATRKAINLVRRATWLKHAETCWN